MIKAVWNDKVLAESDQTVVVEGNHYFPHASVAQEYLRDSKTVTTCPWKGEAHYYSIDVDGRCNADAAWFYPDPKAEADQIRGHVAFWKGVTVG